jgi:hypothetical protein
LDSRSAGSYRGFTMLLPRKCPICERSSIEPILQTVKIMASYERFQGEVGGLQVYRCTEFGHIFFVRISDLGEADSETMAS